MFPAGQQALQEPASNGKHSQQQAHGQYRSQASSQHKQMDKLSKQLLQAMREQKQQSQLSARQEDSQAASKVMAMSMMEKMARTTRPLRSSLSLIFSMTNTKPVAAGQPRAGGIAVHGAPKVIGPLVTKNGLISEHIRDVQFHASNRGKP